MLPMTEFDDLTKRILDRLDTFEDKIEKLCERLMKVEYELKTHFKEQEDKRTNKDRKFYIIIAGMGILFTLVEVIQNFK
jgi:DNA mismatch repair ATPase MutS